MVPMVRTVFLEPTERLDLQLKTNRLKTASSVLPDHLDPLDPTEQLVNLVPTEITDKMELLVKLAPMVELAPKETLAPMDSLEKMDNLDLLVRTQSTARALQDLPDLLVRLGPLEMEELRDQMERQAKTVKLAQLDPQERQEIQALTVNLVPTVIKALPDLIRPTALAQLALRAMPMPTTSLRPLLEDTDAEESSSEKYKQDRKSVV